MQRGTHLYCSLFHGGRVDLVQLLCDYGGSLEAKCTDGTGVWDIATRNSERKLLVVLHERGAKVPKNLEADVSRMLREFEEAGSTPPQANRGELLPRVAVVSRE